MKLICLSLSAALLATSAAAGNMVIPAPSAPAPAPAVAAAPGWSGAYVGGMAAQVSGPLLVLQTGIQFAEWENEGTVFGGFAGYAVQRGNLVFGAEAAYLAGMSVSTGGGDDIRDFIDLKARLGFAADRVLVYGAVGWSFATLLDYYVDPPEALPLSGLNYGAGIDVLVTDRIFVGAEYLVRDLAGDYNQIFWPGESVETTQSTISVRVGYKF